MMQDFEFEQEQNLNNFPDPTQSPESRAELREVLDLLLLCFGTAVESIQKSAKNVRRTRRRLYILHHLAVCPADRPSRRELASILNLSIYMLDKEIAYCRTHLRKACLANHLPEDAFENLVVGLTQI